MPATYTIRLRELVRNNDDVGLWDYPIFDEDYRKLLNEKIINNYLMREIGCESPSIFAQRMHTRMCNIMPVYNKVYLATQRDYDPFNTVSMRTLNEAVGSGSQTHEDTATGSNTGANTTGSRAIVSQYPSSRLAGNENYATSGTDTESNSQSTNTTDNKANSQVDSVSENSATSETVGYDRPIWEIVDNLTRSFVNTDLMIVGELEDLFMQLHNNNDSTYGRDSMFVPMPLFPFTGSYGYGGTML